MGYRTSTERTERGGSAGAGASLRRSILKRAAAGLLSLVMAVGALGLSTGGAEAASTADSATLLMASMGVISADSSGNYNLSGNVTRGEFAKMIVKASSYKDLVAAGVYSSPFKDVPASSEYAPYIRLAVSNGLLSGYSDGTFRPDSTMTLEQAVNGVLKLLGYAQSDFQGAFPYAQMNTYASIGLSKNITGSTGTTLSRSAAVNLLYNLMSTNVKDGSQKYAETLGYTVNNSGEVNYADIVSDNMNGPYTVTTTGWMSALGVTSTATVYRNGSLASTSDVALYDVLYYSGDKTMVWAYTDKVTGVYEKANPSQNAVTKVTVSGKEYELESTAAFAALSSTGTLKIGEAVTLLMGKDGGVADAVSASKVNESTIIYVTETGTKSYEDSNGKTYTSTYIKGVTPTGLEAEYAVSVTWVEEGDTVSVSFTGTNMSVSGLSSSGLTGTVNSSQLTIGSSSVSSSVSILDVYEGAYAVTSLSRINGLTLSSGDVLYYKKENGQITQLVLNNVTGDALEYGVVISAKSNSSGLTVSGSYSYDIDGVTRTLSTQNSALGVSAGPAAFYGAGNTISTIRNLSSITAKVTEATASTVTAGGSTYAVSPNVKVYEKDGSDYKLTTLSAALSAGSKATYYYDFDRSAATGAQIRVIVIAK